MVNHYLDALQAQKVVTGQLVALPLVLFVTYVSTAHTPSSRRFRSSRAPTSSSALVANAIATFKAPASSPTARCAATNVTPNGTHTAGARNARRPSPTRSSSQTTHVWSHRSPSLVPGVCGGGEGTGGTRGQDVRSVWGRVHPGAPQCPLLLRPLPGGRSPGAGQVTASRGIARFDTVERMALPPEVIAAEHALRAQADEEKRAGATGPLAFISTPGRCRTPRCQRDDDRSATGT